MRTILTRDAGRDNAVSFAVRADAPPIHPAGPGHLIIPPSRRPFREIQADGRLSNGARRLAAHLDGRCLANGKWVAWPKVSTIAAELGWGGDSRAFRKRVERYFRELIGSGDVARTRLGELVAWFDAEGARSGLAWPKGLRRGLCRSAAITVLGWKLAEAERLPSLTPCDIPVASSGPAGGVPASPDVACDPPGMSHGDPPGMSHPQNVRSLNEQSERTSDDVVAIAAWEGEPPTMPIATPAETAPAAGPAVAPAAGPVAAAEPSPPAVAAAPVAAAPVAAAPAVLAPAVLAPAVLAADPARSHAAHRLASSLLVRDGSGRFRDLRPRVGDDGSIAWQVPPGAGPAPDAAELAEIERLRPEFLAELKGRGFKVPPPPSPAAAARDGAPASVAARVPRAVRDRVTALIAGHEAAGSPAGDVATGRAMGEAIGDAKPESIEAFASYARDVRSGRLPLDALIGAFGAACGPRARNRGAVLVDRVRGWKAGHPGWSEGRGSSPAAPSR